MTLRNFEEIATFIGEESSLGCPATPEEVETKLFIWRSEAAAAERLRASIDRLERENARTLSAARRWQTEAMEALKEGVFLSKKLTGSHGLQEYADSCKAEAVRLAGIVGELTIELARARSQCECAKN